MEVENKRLYNFHLYAIYVIPNSDILISFLFRKPIFSPQLSI